MASTSCTRSNIATAKQKKKKKKIEKIEKKKKYPTLSPARNIINYPISIHLAFTLVVEVFTYEMRKASVIAVMDTKAGTIQSSNSTEMLAVSLRGVKTQLVAVCLAYIRG